MGQPARLNLRGLLGRTSLIVIAATAALGAVAATLLGLIYLGKPRSGFNVTYVSDPQIEFPPIANQAAAVQYQTVSVRPTTPLPEVETLQDVAFLAPIAVFVLGCLLTLLLCWRLWSGRPFSALATWGLAIVGAAVTGLAALTPWLKATAVARGVAALHLPVVSESATADLPSRWVVPPVWTWEDTEWPMLVLGLVLLLIAMVVRRGELLQQDSEGLI